MKVLDNQTESIGKVQRGKFGNGIVRATMAEG